MTSFVRALKRTVSGTKEGEATSPQTSPLALSQPQRGSSLTTSPSFSDFSLSAHIDAEAELSVADVAQKAEPRFSLDDVLPSSPRWLHSTTSLGRSSALQIPRDAVVQELPAKEASALPHSLPRRREGKIGGMDYYDYCELIRGSSL